MAFEKAQRTTLSAPQSSSLAPQFDEREEGTGDAHRLTSASDCFCVADGASSPTAPRRWRRLVADGASFPLSPGHFASSFLSVLRHVQLARPPK